MFMLLEFDIGGFECQVKIGKGFVANLYAVIAA